MNSYKKLIAALRDCGNQNFSCRYCKLFGNEYCKVNLSLQAACAIEELLAKVRSVVHCKDCEWWTKQEASIQGRCARLAIYPTGEFYCAAGSKAEPPKGVE